MRTVIRGPAFAGLLAAAAAGAVVAQTPPPSLGTCGGQTVTFSDIQLPQAVLANGKRLAAGRYQIRITTEHPTPAVGQSATGECWVEFVANGSVAGRELASVIPADDIAKVAKGPAPQPNAARVDVLKGGEHVRVWMNDAGTHYVVNLPVAKEN